MPRISEQPSVNKTNLVTVAKTGGDFTTIQAAIDYAVVTYPSRSFNDPVIITVQSGEYREQIHSYQHILIQSEGAAYDPIQGQAKVTIINTGDVIANSPLRTNVGDVYYMVGISIITDTDPGILGRMPEGTFKNCSTWNGHFIENELENVVSQFKDCKFGSNTYGGFYVAPQVQTFSSDIVLDRCIFQGTPTFKSTHTGGVQTVNDVDITGVTGLLDDGVYTTIATTVVPAGGTGCTLDVTVVGGVITTVTVSAVGTVYSVDDVLTINAAILSPSTGATGTVDFTVNAIWTVGFITTRWSEVRGNLDIGGDWGIEGFQLRTLDGGSVNRNIFDTSTIVKFDGGIQINGMHFTKSPNVLHLGSISFESSEANLIPDGEADITATVVVSGRVQGNIMHNGLSSNIHMSNPDKYVGAEVNDSYMTIKDALDSITDSSSTNRYTIALSSGVYVEDNPLQAKEYCTIKAAGDLQTTRIVAANPNTDLLIMANLFTIEGVAFWGVSGDTNYAINQSGIVASTSVTRCMFGECRNAILVNDVGGKMVINDCAVFNPTVDLLTGLTVQSGVCNVFSFHASFGNIDTLVSITGADSECELNYVNSVLSTLTTGISIHALAHADIINPQLRNMGTGVEIDGGAEVHTLGLRIHDASVDGLRINDVGANTTMSIQSAIVHNSANYDFNFLSDTCLAEGSVSSSLNNLNFVPGARVYGTLLDLEEDDEGMTILGELHVGTPEGPTESLFGEGDSYTRGMLAYTWDGTDYVDISAAARSPSASQFTFPNIVPLVGDAIYLASDLIVGSTGDYHKYFGIKMLSTVAQVGGTIVCEYWNGATWLEVNHMTTESGGSYYRKADQLFNVTAGAYQVRFDPILYVDTWTKNDPPAVDAIDRYWIRFRISSITLPVALTVLPEFEQFKLHASRHEINADGFEEDMGTARPYVSVPVSWNTFRDIGVGATDVDLFLSTHCKAGFISNSLADGDSVGTVTTLPSWVDTSATLRVRVTGVPDGGTHNYTLIAYLNSSKTGTPVSTSAVVDVTGEVSDSVTVAGVDGQQITWEFNLPIYDKGVQQLIEDPDSIWINIEAQADFAANVVNGMQFELQALSWRRGTHQ